MISSCLHIRTLLLAICLRCMMADILQEWAQQGRLSEAKLSSDGKSLTLDDVTLNAAQETDVSHDGKACSYTLASLFLQVLDPNQGLMVYRNACKAHSLTDPVKALDKPTVVGFILGDNVSEEATEAPVVEAPKAAVAPEPPIRKHGKRSSEGREGRGSTEKKKSKRTKAPMTNEQLFSNLSVVVDKRAVSEEAALEITKALSAEGFDVTPELLEKGRADLEWILPLEIPVGNSASVLCPATAVERDFARVLELYNESTSNTTAAAAAAAAAAKTKKSSTHLAGKKPVIVVPKGMTCPITMMNAHEFFSNAKFVPPKRGGVQKPPATFARRVAARLGGGTVEYELMDNPVTKLGQDPREWQRIVAVIALGQAWQFKDWPGKYADPVHLFGRTYGFYIAMEGDTIPAELEGWAVRKGKLNRDKRGLDSVTHASFWNGLDEWMAVHKAELLPQTS